MQKEATATSNKILFINTITFTICFAAWMLNGVLVTFLTSNQLYDWSLSEIGWLIGIPVLTGAIFRLPAGILTDKYGGKPIMWKTGHSLIKQRMAELNCKLGGEMSGHIFFADDYYGFDDALYVAARIIQTLSKSNKTLSELKSELPKYYSTPELRLECRTDAEKFQISDKAINYFVKNRRKAAFIGIRRIRHEACSYGRAL